MTEAIREAIESADVERLRALVTENPSWADADVTWGDGGKNVVPPLHFVCDAVFRGLANQDQALAMANVLLDAGVDPELEYAASGDTFLISAASLGAESVGLRLLEAGVDVTPAGSSARPRSTGRRSWGSIGSRSPSWRQGPISSASIRSTTARRCSGLCTHGLRARTGTVSAFRTPRECWSSAARGSPPTPSMRSWVRTTARCETLCGRLSALGRACGMNVSIDPGATRRRPADRRSARRRSACCLLGRAAASARATSGRGLR